MAVAALFHTLGAFCVIGVAASLIVLVANVVPKRTLLSRAVVVRSTRPDSAPRSAQQ